MDNKKLNGIYYTPTLLADFVIKYIFEEYTFNKEINILEPSCGDGVFINSLTAFSKSKDFNFNISLVEIDKKELSKIENNNKGKYKNIRFSYYSQDFLMFQVNNKKKYDLIIGNPPYINKRYMSSEQVEIGNKILEDLNVSPSTIKNIWIAFLVSATASLNEDGVLCFVLPSEILQVNHSSSIRNYLLNNFHSIEIFTFNEIIFENIEQDTIVFIGSKKANKKGFHYHSVKKLLDINTNSLNTISYNELINIDEKWTSLLLGQSVLEKINYLKKNIQPVSDYCSSSTGIVTAANDDFIITDDALDKFKLHKFAHPIIKKSSYIKNLINFKIDDFNKLKNGNATNLLLFNGEEKNTNENVEDYLQALIEKGITERYKFKKRNIWYIIPSVWQSEGFFFKRSHLYPKVIINTANVSVTDTAYRIKMKENFNINSFTFSFYNSLTLVFAEMYGRFYGGGVLELTPNEFKKLPIPYLEVSPKQLNELDEMFRSGKDFNSILDYTNNIVLRKGLGFSDYEIELLDSTRLLLINRRLKSK